MKVELVAEKIFIDGIDVFEHIGKIEIEANSLAKRIVEAIEWGKYNLDRYQRKQLEKILKGVEEK